MDQILGFALKIKGMLDLRVFGEAVVGGRAVSIRGFSGIETKRFAFLRTFLSYPYTIATSQPLTGPVLDEIKGGFRRGEIALTYPHPLSVLSLPSPVVRRDRKYHKERRRLIRRAEERSEVVRKVPFEGFYTLYSRTAKGHGRRPIPRERMERIYPMEGVDVVGVEVDGVLSGAIMSLALPDRYLLWQMGWRGPSFLPTYLLHLALEMGFDRGYDLVDLGISPSPASLKLKYEMGGDPERRVFVIRW